MHSMTAHTRGILWKIIEPRSRSWLCCIPQANALKFRQLKTTILKVQTPNSSKAIDPKMPATTATCDLPRPSVPSFNDWK